ncbi:hypothetical protein EV192_104380 [Actinocrispum wychmicini]|uniref:Uncharacterized protein n=1 Tax=Actinocrispum wychmicini TaxID=1213861 RepID=A0A4R2JL12_9PSEU|nr:hypothetical protein EV192_104380 [Actinocrispum wychmicini]
MLMGWSLEDMPRHYGQRAAAERAQELRLERRLLLFASAVTLALALLIRCSEVPCSMRWVAFVIRLIRADRSVDNRREVGAQAHAVLACDAQPLASSSVESRCWLS